MLAKKRGRKGGENEKSGESEGRFCDDISVRAKYFYL